MSNETDKINMLLKLITSQPEKHVDHAAREKSEAVIKDAAINLVGVVLINLTVATDALIRIAEALEQQNN